ncbi:hypothetical protein C0995_002200 [Termitomyces sp. Mi166|nr:hypothetical protein C0995_002200 [Termitomyces sp. Mi166\
MPVQRLHYTHRPESTATALHESPMGEEAEPEPLSAYARWKIEEDEKFYMTFPEARCAAQQYNTLSSAYLVGTGYYYNEGGRIVRSNEITCYPSSSYTYSVYDDDVASLEPQRINNDCRYNIDYNDSDLARALAPMTRDGATRPSVPSKGHYDRTPPPPQAQSPVESNHINTAARSHQPPPILEPPIMDSLLSPDSPTQFPPFYNTHPNPAPTNISKSEYSHPSLAYADPSLYQMPVYSRSYNFYPNASQAGWPPFPRSMRLSPLPPSRRPIAKKPPLACLFCRGRKIACGPPDPGSSNRSCK